MTTGLQCPKWRISGTAISQGSPVKRQEMESGYAVASNPAGPLLVLFLSWALVE